MNRRKRELREPRPVVTYRANGPFIEQIDPALDPTAPDRVKRDDAWTARAPWSA